MEALATKMAELVSRLISLGGVERVLWQLLRELIPVSGLRTISEALLDAPASARVRWPLLKPPLKPLAVGTASFIRMARN